MQGASRHISKDGCYSCQGFCGGCLNLDEFTKELGTEPGIPMGRKNWLFCWTEVGAEYVGKIQSLLVTCRLHGINPYTYFVDVLQRVSITKAADVADLTPIRWKEIFAHQPLASDLERQ